jgi:hypothetical protein
MENRNDETPEDTTSQQGSQGERQRDGNAGPKPGKSEQDDRADRQIDDNQDDLGRDVNNPEETSNAINKQT